MPQSRGSGCSELLDVAQMLRVAPVRARIFRADVQPAWRRSAEVIASRPMSRWLSPSNPVASIASGATRAGIGDHQIAIRRPACAASRRRR